MSSKTIDTKLDDANGGFVPKTAILAVFSVTGIPEIEVSNGVSVADILDHGADQPILAG